MYGVGCTLESVIVFEEVIHKCLAAEIHVYSSNELTSKLCNATCHLSENIIEIIQTCPRIRLSYLPRCTLSSANLIYNTGLLLER